MIIGCEPSNKGAVGCYRLIQPLHKAHEDAENLQDTHVALLHHNINQRQYEALAPKIDVFVYQYPQLKPALEHVKFMSADNHTLSVVEIDDDVWNMDARQENYAYFGTREVKMNGKYVYKDGKNGFDLKANRERMSVLADCLVAADLVTVTTPYLKEVMVKNLKEAGKEKPKVAVLPNCLDLNHWDPVEIVKDEIRIMWQGGHGHRHDLAEAVPALKKVLKKYPEVKVVFAANSWKEIEEALGKDRIIVNRAWTSFDAHPYRMKLLGADIAISPLTDVPFNCAKSELKFTEAAALKVPTVASDIVTYNSVIKHGETGFLAKTTEDWVKHLSALVEDEKLRKKVGESARKWVEDNRDAHKTYHLWPELYAAHLETKKALS